MLTTLLLASALQVMGDPDPRGLRVGPGEEFTTLREALAAAAPGDTVRLAAGVHPGPIRIRVPLVLTGDSGAVLDGGGKGSIVEIEADSVEVRGVELRNSGRSLDGDDAAVALLRCTGCRIIDNRIVDALHGVYLLESRDIVLRGNRIEGAKELPEARRGNGIHLFNSNGVVIEGNVVRHARDGIYFSFSSHNAIVENDVAEVRYGLHYMYSDDNRFERNRFTRNAAGAAIMFSSRILFRDNTFAQHVGYRAYGILLQTVYSVTAERNRIEGNVVGVFLDMASGNRFVGNVISGNGIGIDLIASAEDNTFVGNVIAGNRTAVRKPNGDAVNVWAEEGRGNYWGHRSIYDLDGDGIGDRPYPAGDPFAGLAATRPVLEVFAGTPSALALSWAEGAFPVFDLPRVEDPAPLVEVPAELRGRHSIAAPGRDGGRSTAAAVVPLLMLVAAGGARRLLHARRR